MPSKKFFRNQKEEGRKVRPIQSGKTVWLFCEGKTEKVYFEELAIELRLSTLRVVDVSGAPITVVDEAVKKKREIEKDFAQRKKKEPELDEADKDEVWAVFDTENIADNPSYFAAVDKARANSVDLAISNPCFEFWFLLHFVDTDAAFHHCAEVMDRLKTHIKDYEKGKDNSRYLVAGLREKAIEKAKRIFDDLTDQANLYKQTCTTIFTLLEKLVSLTNP
jgi:RloB-like protein